MTKLYVCNNEYKGAVVGTLESIQDFIEDHQWNTGDCEFFELGKQVYMKFRMERIGDD